MNNLKFLLILSSLSISNPICSMKKEQDTRDMKQHGTAKGDFENFPPEMIIEVARSMIDWETAKIQKPGIKKQEIKFSAML